MGNVTLPKKAALISIFLILCVGYSYGQSQTFSSTTTFTVPPGVTSILVEAWGGGGHGSTMSSSFAGGGGGGGAFASKMVSVVPGNTYTVNVGSGSSSSSPGGDSWFINSSTVLAKGGNSVGNNNASGASGGSAFSCIGTVVKSGGDGANGSGSNGGGGGSSASSTSAGTDATTWVGANAPGNGGDGGNGGTSNEIGHAGTVPGGGGGGAHRSFGTKAGGNGANGRVILTWYVNEINLVGNTTTIVDGDSTPSFTDFTDFGTTDISSGTVVRTFTIQNTGTGDLSIGAISFAGANAGDFTLTSTPASTVAASSSTTFSITFNPSAVGLRSATVSIANDDSNENPYNFTIQGTGGDPEINVAGNGNMIPDGDITPMAADLTDFGSIYISGGTIAKNYVIQNVTGSSMPLSISGVTISGANAADFTVTTNPNSSVGVGSSTTLGITFNPSALGLRTATVSIANNDSNENPYTFKIQGTGSDPEINVTGNSFTILTGDVTPSVADGTNIGSTDAVSGTVSQTFVIQNLNSGNSALVINSITMSGANPGDFTVTTAPASSISIGGATTFVLTFDPGAVGVRNAIVNINSNDSDESPYTFAVTGTGTDPEIDVIGNGFSIVDGDVTASLADFTHFGSVEVTAGTMTHTFTINNMPSATAPLTINSIVISGANAGDFTVSGPVSSTLAIGGSTTFSITFNPSATGVRSATVTINNNDSNETAYDFSIVGVGSIVEINVVGNLISIPDGDTTPSVSDNTDFGTVSVDAGSALVTYTIQNSGSVGSLNIGQISISGPNAADFSVALLPSATIANGSNTSFKISFNPTTVGIKNATISIVNDDTNENPYDFAVTGLGVRTYPDTDGDNVSDNNDIDDDNDGMSDITEQQLCTAGPYAGSITYTFLNETFGAGTTKGLINVNIPNATCTYCFEDGIVGPNTADCPSQSSWILDDGEYVVTHKIAGTVASDPDNIHGDLAWNGAQDHTPSDVNGRMAVFNASYTPGIFYETTINGIIPNIPVTYSFWVMNIMQQSNYSGSILPNITVEFLDTSGTVLSTFNTGNIGRCSSSTSDNTCGASNWLQFTTSVNLGSVTTFVVRFKNNAPGGGGNDLAIDDITLKQTYCDTDGDGIANLFDLDSDNDGIPDVEEAGFKGYTIGRGTFSTWADSNSNGFLDNIEAAIAGGWYVIPDTDGDGVPDVLDLDSDNDSIFDVDEAGLLNGDGDINGDGVGDLGDSDKDGVLDLYDSNSAWGTQTRPFALDTDGNGTPDYRQLDSDNNGVKDIAGTLYATLDANNDGKIDGSADGDKDGILDAFDTNTLKMGSPRDLNRKLYLDLDGRNDYAEGTQLTGGLAKATIMGWVKLTPPFATTAYVIGQDNMNLKIDTSSGRKLSATAKGVTVTFGTDLVVNRWYHIAAVYDGSNATEKLKLYVNGNPEISSNSGTLAGTLPASTVNFTIGKNPSANDSYFKGSVDEIRMFNSALTDDQIQKMVFQEIKANGAAIRGEVVPKDIESSTWSSLKAYYRMDAYKDNVIDNYTTAGIDAGTSSSLARIYNVKNLKYQLAPMPFETSMAGALDIAVSQNNFVNGTDAYTYDWTIVRVKHNVTLPYNSTDLGLIIDPSVKYVVNNDNMIKNTWYLALNGSIDLQGKSQLVQTATSDLDPSSSGSIERDQQGTVNKYNYNYWGSPVGAINTSTNNNAFTVAGVLRDGTNAANPLPLQWTSGLDGSPTTPITLSSYWIFKFQNVTNSYANWATVGPNGTLLAGQGFTLKGSNAATATQNYTFIGKPNNGVITTTVAANNLNLCGNPYASALDADAFITQNLGATTGTLYFWEHYSTNNTHYLADYQGGYATRTLVGGTPAVAPPGISGLGSSSKVPGRFIPVGQGFFITANTTGGTVTFSNNQRGFVKEDHATSNTMFRVDPHAPNYSPFNNNDEVFEEDTYGKIRLGFTSFNNYHRQVLIGFMDEKATSAIDPGYDAIHIDSQPNDMYFLNGSTKVNIAGESYFNENAVYPLGVKTSTAGPVKFTLDATENFDASQAIYIHDNVTNIYHDIKADDFSIELPAGVIENRFTLRFVTGTALGVNETAQQDGIEVTYTNANSILAIYNHIADSNVKTVSLYNMLGQLISQWDVSNDNQSHIQIPVKNISTGTYIVKMTTDKGDFSRKIAVK